MPLAAALGAPRVLREPRVANRDRVAQPCLAARRVPCGDQERRVASKSKKNVRHAFLSRILLAGIPESCLSTSLGWGAGRRLAAMASATDCHRPGAQPTLRPPASASRWFNLVQDSRGAVRPRYHAAWVRTEAEQVAPPAPPRPDWRKPAEAPASLRISAGVAAGIRGSPPASIARVPNRNDGSGGREMKPLHIPLSH